MYILAVNDRQRSVNDSQRPWYIIRCQGTLPAVNDRQQGFVKDRQRLVDVLPIRSEHIRSSVGTHPIRCSVISSSGRIMLSHNSIFTTSNHPLKAFYTFSFEVQQFNSRQVTFVDPCIGSDHPLYPSHRVFDGIPNGDDLMLSEILSNASSLRGLPSSVNIPAS